MVWKKQWKRIFSASCYQWKQRKNKKHEELWSKIRDLIRSTTKNSDDHNYDEKYIKIKFDSDDKLPLNETIEIPTIAIVVRGIFLENSKYYPHVVLDECLYTMKYIAVYEWKFKKWVKRNWYWKSFVLLLWWYN